MDWFEKLTGFREANYEDTRAMLAVEGSRLRSLVNGKNYGIGELELVSLQTLRERAKSGVELPGRLKVSVVRGDIRKMHQSPENARALFQVASQFNLLEMTSYQATPEHGVTGYQHDHTQGPPILASATGGEAEILCSVRAFTQPRPGADSPDSKLMHCRASPIAPPDSPPALTPQR